MQNLKVEAGCARLREVLDRGVLLKSIARNRYLDVGDWGDSYAYAVHHLDSRSTAGVLVHEIAEKLLCDYEGITALRVDADDAAVLVGTKHRQQVCYWRQHLIALRIERIFCEALGLDWNEHEKNVNEAFERQEELMSGARMMKGGKKALAKKMGKKDMPLPKRGHGARRDARVGR